MDEYFIGAGALLTAGPNASIAGATLHAQTSVPLARESCALVDFEATAARDLSRILIVAGGWSASRFQAEVVEPLVARRECALADVLEILAGAAGTGEIHLFAHWQPDAALTAALAARGLQVHAHSLEELGRAALISGQRVARWSPPVRAA